MKIAEILRAAKARLIEHGWCQGDEHAIHGKPDGPCCAATALYSGDMNLTIAVEQAADVLKAAIDIPGQPLGAWNDAPERTLEDVLAVYDKAIALAENERLGTQ